MKSRLVPLVALLLWLSVSIAGCGSDPADVAGSYTMASGDVVEGRIVYRPKSTSGVCGPRRLQ